MLEAHVAGLVAQGQTGRVATGRPMAAQYNALLLVATGRPMAAHYNALLLVATGRPMAAPCHPGLTQCVHTRMDGR